MKFSIKCVRVCRLRTINTGHSNHLIHFEPGKAGMEEEGQAGMMEEGQASMEEGQASMEEGQASMEEGQDSCVLQAKAAGFKSTVADLIDFKPTENPKWRTAEDLNIPDVQGMIKQIAEYHREWRNLKSTACVSEITEDLVYQFIYNCNLEGEHGCGTLEDTKNCLKENTNDETRAKEKQTINLRSAYRYLQDDIKKGEHQQEDNHGFIDESMLLTLNEKILKDIKLRKNATKPGVYSDKKRLSVFEGETYEYPDPNLVDLQKLVVKVLDNYNDLYQDAQQESDNEKRLEKLFKISSYFLFEMLDVHPFGDGNGRLCRLLCNYVLSTCTPFPSPIYNSYSKSSRDDYVGALVEARKSEDRHPRSLTTMIIECNYTTWEKFIQRIKSSI
ncbi:uncharacterized protein LOC117301629 [Asterias rubens]|uniref:uncharacterized protein LOC117301629 n=1 Tax=Asterias rubens TaxID=7604 RepID=UPI0014559B8E|nr:uncharacterized protein LOC117301629 [Asterias rubens]